MDRHGFLNALRALHNIDRHELIDAGVDVSDDRHWVHFRETPARWLMAAPTHHAERVWAIVERHVANPLTPFVGVGAALTNALAGLKAAKPILDSVRPDEGQAPDPEVSRAALLVDRAISQAESAR